VKPELLKRIDSVLGRMLTHLSPPCVPAEEGKVLQSILLIRPGGIGDAVLLAPVIRALKERFPGVAIDVLAERRNAGVFPLCSGIRSVYRYDVPSEFLVVFRSRYDVVIDTEQWHRLSAVVARLVRSSVKIGYGTNERRRMFTTSVPYFHDRYEAESFFDLVAPLGVSAPPPLDIPFLRVSARSLQRASELLMGLDGRRYVAVFAGASIPERRWGTDRFAEVARRISSLGYAVVVVVGGEDREAGAVIAGAVPSSLNLSGQTSLEVTAAVIAGAALLVSGDSGVLHIGVGLGVPTVSLFGPGIARKWAPRGPGHGVLNHGLACSPCTRFGTTPPCPYGVRCLAEITPDEVVRAAMELLGERGRPAGTEKPLDNFPDGC
jgi:lipopolysaccharide heptosyltransferase II